MTAWTHNFTRIAAVVTSAGAATACLFNPDYEADNCELRCTRSCLPGFVCRDGYCVTPDFGGSCEAAVLREAQVIEARVDASALVEAGPATSSTLDSGAGFDALDASPYPSEAATMTIGVVPPSSRLAISSPTVLPEACAGLRYEYRLEAKGGSGFYTWADGGKTLPDWLSLSLEGELSGLPPLDSVGEEDMTVLVQSGIVDGADQRSIKLPIRRSCQFGFIGEVGNRARMMLGDVRRANRPNVFASRDLTADFPADVDVRAFEFSPAGEVIAFGVGKEDETQMTSLWVTGVTELASALPLTELLPRAPDRIIRDFVFSPSSDHIAVLTSSTTTRDHELFVAPLGNKVTETTLVGQVVPFEWSELFTASEYVCYFSEAGARVCSHFASESRSEDALTVNTIAKLEDPERVQWVSAGQFQGVYHRASTSDDFELMLLHMDSLDGEPEQSRTFEVRAILDPSITVLAQPGTQAQWSAPEPQVGIWTLNKGMRTYGEPHVPPIAVHDCKRILAWAPEGRALACHTDDNVRIALIHYAQASTHEQVVTPNVAPTVEALPRTFNYGATRYLYDTVTEGLMMVDLTTPTWSPELLRKKNAADTVAFEALTDGQVLVHVASALFVFDPQSNVLQEVNTHEQPLSSPLPCEGRFGWGGPYGWCGSTLLSQKFAASSAARTVIFPDSQRRLFAVDLDDSRGPQLVATDAKVDCMRTRREYGRPALLALGCEQEIKWSH